MGAGLSSAQLWVESQLGRNNNPDWNNVDPQYMATQCKDIDELLAIVRSYGGPFDPKELGDNGDDNYVETNIMPDSGENSADNEMEVEAEVKPVMKQGSSEKKSASAKAKRKIHSSGDMDTNVPSGKELVTLK
mmetsp:Transcript_26259/g.38927  ORF Transcript_26259/g.38927 Transcript_26259/m.38927 type:complete len:133 (+) Transcript_26259:103-501(+)|eukprot:CAMPEP_0185026116 /NCGR_PEP_ID=MMETSP1103-20130426/9981_1 /TAXON_ID=36769 /ORGANISM="Paraphysomonas bandaiensis, Strain Caron Lab Isolate" /LENGTH=132 /DNA_ID=CAMNT_0027559587 /DNA_START=23 /DNA_END=421 /DNA_ORIENTATION=+